MHLGIYSRILLNVLITSCLTLTSKSSKTIKIRGDPKYVIGKQIINEI